jgi:hypothetical protein
MTEELTPAALDLAAITHFRLPDSLNELLSSGWRGKFGCRFAL